MSGRLEPGSPATWRRPERDRRPRRRRAFVVIGFAVGSFALTALLVVALEIELAKPVSEAPEGMAAMAFATVAVMAFLAGCGLLAFGLVLLRPRIVRTPRWLVDPEDRTRARWWDGHAWTEHTAERGPITLGLLPLVSSSRRRRRGGAIALALGLAVAVGCSWIADATVTPATTPGIDENTVSLLASQAVMPSLGVALVGLYLLLTLSPDPPEGWYADPADAASLRWWDGQDWADVTTSAAPTSAMALDG